MEFLEFAANWAWETSLAASVLIALALAASAVLRKPVFAPIRHMLGLLVVARLLLPFALPSPLSIFNWLRPSETFLTSVTTPPPKEGLVTLSPTVSGEMSLEPSVPKAVARRNFPILPAIWLAGVVVILGRVIRQHVKVRRWVSERNRIASGSAREALESALELNGCRRRFKLYSVEGLSTPALFGLMRPAILLPTELVACSDVARLRMVCLHEIAHFRRMDVAINWLMIFAQALHWFNPLVWIAMRRLRAEQELLCDADVMRLLCPEEHHSYGETLLALAAPRGYSLSTLIPISSNFKQLKERIAMIKQFKSATNRLLVFTLPPLAAILAIVTFTGATKKEPTKPALAAPVTQKEVTEQSRAEKAAKGIAVLEDQWHEQNNRVQNMELAVDRLRKELKLSPIETEAELNALSAEALRSIEKDRIRAEQEYVQFERLWKEIQSKSRQEQIEVIPTAYRDEALDRLLHNLEAAEQKIVGLKIDFDSKHPDVQRAEALIKEINRQIDSRLAGIVKGLETLVSARRAVAESLAKRADEIKIMDGERLEAARPYLAAKQQLEAQRKLRDTLYLRLMQEKVDRQLQKD